MTEPPTEPPPETEPETEAPTGPAPDGPPATPEGPLVTEPPPQPPEQTDVRTTELLERRARRQADADEARTAMNLHNARATVLREQVAADMGPELAGRYEDLAKVSDAMGKVARRVWKYHQARVDEVTTELGTPSP
jgi:hypothetical protein